MVAAEIEKEEKMKSLNQKLQTKNDLNSRQWQLYNMLIEHSLTSLDKLTHRQMLDKIGHLYDFQEDMEDHPDTPFNNLTSRRQLSDDLDAIVKSQNIHYVYVGGRFAVGQTEIDLYLLKKEIQIKKQWSKLYIQKAKAVKDNQVRIKFHKEKQVYESYVRDKENKVFELEEQLKFEYQRI
jgi:hypothetical protein